VFNAAVAGAQQVVIELWTSSEVDSHLCASRGHVRVLLDYRPVARDTDGNAIPDECENCQKPLPPVLETPVIAKNRYLSIIPGNEDHWTALRVNFTTVPAWAGPVPPEPFWVDRPWLVRSVSGGIQAFSRLTCQPVFMDWSEFAVVHVGDRSIIPGASYAVRGIDLACVPPETPLTTLVGSAGFSDPLPIATSALWGDVSGFGLNVPLNQRVDLFDVVVVADVVRGVASAAMAVRGDLFPAEPDGEVDVRDLASVVDAIVGYAYPYPLDHRCR
jgi:hypothetical protein